MPYFTPDREATRTGGGAGQAPGGGGAHWFSPLSAQLFGQGGVGPGPGQTQTTGQTTNNAFGNPTRKQAPVPGAPGGGGSGGGVAGGGVGGSAQQGGGAAPQPQRAPGWGGAQTPSQTPLIPPPPAQVPPLTPAPAPAPALSPAPSWRPGVSPGLAPAPVPAPGFVPGTSPGLAPPPIPYPMPDQRQQPQVAPAPAAGPIPVSQLSPAQLQQIQDANPSLAQAAGRMGMSVTDFLTMQAQANPEFYAQLVQGVNVANTQLPADYNYGALPSNFLGNRAPAPQMTYNGAPLPGYNGVPYVPGTQPSNMPAPAPQPAPPPAAPAPGRQLARAPAARPPTQPARSPAPARAPATATPLVDIPTATPLVDQLTTPIDPSSIDLMPSQANLDRLQWMLGPSRAPNPYGRPGPYTPPGSPSLNPVPGMGAGAGGAGLLSQLQGWGLGLAGL